MTALTAAQVERIRRPLWAMEQGELSVAFVELVAEGADADAVESEATRLLAEAPGDVAHFWNGPCDFCSHPN